MVTTITTLSTAVSIYSMHTASASELLPFHPRTRELQVKQQERDVAFFEKLGIDPTKGTSPSIDR